MRRREDSEDTTEIDRDYDNIKKAMDKLGEQLGDEEVGEQDVNGIKAVALADIIADVYLKVLKERSR